jgi:hypothetical protein
MRVCFLMKSRHFSSRHVRSSRMTARRTLLIASKPFAASSAHEKLSRFRYFKHQRQAPEHGAVVDVEGSPGRRALGRGASPSCSWRRDWAGSVQDLSHFGGGGGWRVRRSAGSPAEPVACRDSVGWTSGCRRCGAVGPTRRFQRLMHHTKIAVDAAWRIWTSPSWSPSTSTAGDRETSSPVRVF